MGVEDFIRIGRHHNRERGSCHESARKMFTPCNFVTISEQDFPASCLAIMHIPAEQRHSISQPRTSVAMALCSDFVTENRRKSQKLCFCPFA
jgi:hypothetical protein